MSKPVSTILKERQSGIEDENAGNKNPLFDRKIETATEGFASLFLKIHFIINYRLKTL
jgi:hypothetical protein